MAITEKKSNAENADLNKVMRVGIIGCGSIAYSHVQAYKAAPNVEIVAACDLVEGRAKALLEEYGIENAKTNYRNHLEMLEDNDDVQNVWHNLENEDDLP